MSLRLLPALILFAAFTSPALAQTTPHQPDHPTAAGSGADVNVPAAAKDAVATVDRFSAASSDPPRNTSAAMPCPTLNF